MTSSASARAGVERPGAMKRPGRSLLYLVALVFLGAGTAFATYVLAQAMSGTLLWPRAAETDKPAETVVPRPPTPVGAPSTADGETRKALDAAAALLKTGKLQAAQDRYLDIYFVVSPENPEALNGLVQVRRRAANNNPALLRRQGEAYKAAARRGRDGADHYTSQALWLLARASYLAIAQMELEDQGRVPVVAEVPPTVSRGAGRPGDARSPLASPSNNAPPVAAPQVDMPTPPAPPSQVIPLSPAAAPSPSDAAPAQPSPPDSGPQLTARVGPLSESDDAERLAGQVQREGFAARVATETSESPRRYVVVSEPTSRQIANARARSLATLGMRISIVELDGGLVRLLFGTSPQAGEARSLAREIRARGYTAIVVPEGGTLYFVVIGPHGRAKMDELMGRLSTGTFPVVVTPVP